MTTNVAAQAQSGRAPQKRAEITRDKICEAVIMMLGQGGAKAVTHRAVAEYAGVSLASTTYHFSDKAALLTAAFEWLVKHYVEQARDKLEEAIAGDLSKAALTRHLISVSRQGMSVPEQRVAVCAWYEFMLEASRDASLQQTADAWYTDTCRHYELILERFGATRPKENTRRLVDFLIGYEFVSLAIRPRKIGGSEIEDVYARFVESLYDDEKTTTKTARKKSKART